MYYKHSGSFSIGGLTVGLIVGGFASLILAAVYAVGIILIPEVHLAVVATGAFGGLIGVAAGYGLVWGKVRSPRAAIAVSAVTSIFALYVSWAMWIAIVYQRSQGKPASWASLAEHPAAVWTLMKMINHYGTWGMSGEEATKGWELWVIWVAEAALVIAAAIAAGFAIMQRRPFCEGCGRWCRGGASFLLAPPSDVQQLKLQVESNDLRPLEALGPGPKGGDHLITALHSCTHCNQFHTLSLTKITVQRRKFGHPTVSSRSIVKQLMVGPEQAATLRQVSEKLTQAAKLNPPKANAAAAGK